MSGEVQKTIVEFNLAGYQSLKLDMLDNEFVNLYLYYIYRAKYSDGTTADYFYTALSATNNQVLPYDETNLTTVLYDYSNCPHQFIASVALLGASYDDIKIPTLIYNNKELSALKGNVLRTEDCQEFSLSAVDSDMMAKIVKDTLIIEYLAYYLPTNQPSSRTRSYKELIHTHKPQQTAQSDKTADTSDTSSDKSDTPLDETETTEAEQNKPQQSSYNSTANTSDEQKENTSTSIVKAVEFGKDAPQNTLEQADTDIQTTQVHPQETDMSEQPSNTSEQSNNTEQPATNNTDDSLIFDFSNQPLPTELPTALQLSNTKQEPLVNLDSDKKNYSGLGELPQTLPVTGMYTNIPKREVESVLEILPTALPQKLLDSLK